MLCITSGPARYDAGPMNITDTLALIESAGGRFGFQLLLSIVCGAVVGIERQMRGKAIGIRTAILICLATQIFTRLSITASAADALVDPTRVLGQVVTGVGFLGAGVILARGGSITGVTSAAVVWMLAAIGSTIGMGRPVEALILALLVVFVLIGVRMFEKAFKRLRGETYDAADESSESSDVE